MIILFIERIVPWGRRLSQVVPLIKPGKAAREIPVPFELFGKASDTGKDGFALRGMAWCCARDEGLVDMRWRT